MKSYTDIEQSKKLAEILPLESADMYFEPSAGFCTEPSEVKVGDIKYAHPRSVPCWSLAALLDILPKTLEDGFYDEYELNINMIDKKPEYIGSDNYVHSDFPYNFNNKELLDNIVESIMWLHKQKLL